jgi:DNA primase
MMVVSSNVNLLDHIPTRMKKAGVAKGGEWHGPCPWCDGKDRFIVNPLADGKTWWCRQCGRGGNTIGFIMQYHGKTFAEALDYLNIERPKFMPKRQQHPTRQPDIITTPEDDGKAFLTDGWQAAAEKFVFQSIENLLDPETGSGPRQYLQSRGIPENTGSFLLGYNPESHHEQWGDLKVWLPRGIVIPWEYDNLYWRIRIRRSPKDINPGQDKYAQPAGCGNGMFGISHIHMDVVVVMVEGEFDKLLLDFHLKQNRFHNVVVVATGGTQNARLLRWVSLLSITRGILLAFDDDQPDPKTYLKAGDVAAFWWEKALKTKTRRLRPTAHDVTDMWKAGHDLIQWIREGMS